MFTLFRKRPALAAPTRPPVLRVGQVGRPHSGKTVLLDQFAGEPLQQVFPSGLRLSIDDPRRMALALRQRREAEARLRRHPEASTVHPKVVSFSLVDAGHERATLQVREAVGQVLTHSLPSGSAEQQAPFETYLNHLAEVDVIWQFVPCPPSQATQADRERLGDDVQLTSAFVRAALRRRKATHPAVLAVVVSRIDARYSSEEDARKRMPREFLNWLTAQVRHLAEAPGIGETFIVPVSALGFGAALRRPVQSPTGRSDSLAWDDVEWLLRPGTMPRPFGVATLAAASILAGLRHQPVDDLPADSVPEIVQLCKRLDGDLAALDSWRVPVTADAR